MIESSLTSHDKWNALPNEAIHRYLNKYTQRTAAGKCSSRRKKKIKFLQSILVKREKTIRLLTGNGYNQ